MQFGGHICFWHMQYCHGCVLELIRDAVSVLIIVQLIIVLLYRFAASTIPGATILVFNSVLRTQQQGRGGFPRLAHQYSG